MHPLIQERVADLYATFKAPRPRNVRGCPCCTQPAALEKLTWHGQPRESISASDLDFYARKAMTTVGTTDDFRYFLPRVFEFCLDGKLDTDPEVVFGKLPHGQWLQWPQAEQTALIRLGDAISRWWMESDLQPYQDRIWPITNTSTWACCLGQYFDDLTPHLERLLAPTDAARKNFIAFYDENADAASRGKMANGFWDKHSVSTASAIAWLKSDRVLQAYLAACEC